MLQIRNTKILSVLASAVFVAMVCATALFALTNFSSRWTRKEREMLGSLSLASLGPLPTDPSNRVADDSVAAHLGHALFFDDRLSRTGTVSCASCHVADRNFQDGRPLGQGVGTAARRTMPVAGTAFSPWQFWDGRADSQWEQALGPLESAVEHGGDRTQYAHLIASAYRKEYQTVFGALPDISGAPQHASPVTDSLSRIAWAAMSVTRQGDISRIYANIGKAIAAYERRINFAPSRFDRFVQVELANGVHTAQSAFTNDEQAGLRLFIGKGNCVNCHNGALFTDNHFHNTGVPQSFAPSAPDSGRIIGGKKAIAGEFSCIGQFSDAKPEDCAELRYAVIEGPELLRAFKTPSLRNVVDRAPYMHAGQVLTLTDVVRHYNDAHAAPFGHSELKPLHLSVREQQQIVAFLGTLTAPLSAPDGFLAAPYSRDELATTIKRRNTASSFKNSHSSFGTLMSR